MRFMNRIAIALLFVTLAGTAAFAKTQKKQIDFQKAVKVNGTLVKPGSYDLVFDETASELSIVKNGKVIVKTVVRLEQRDRKARDMQVRSQKTGNDLELVSVTFEGSNKDIVIGQAGMQAGGSN